MLDVWYDDGRYDRATGRPKPETLEKLGLDALSKELWKGAARRAGAVSTASQILEAHRRGHTWVTKLAGGDGTGSRVFVERFAPGDTLARSCTGGRPATRNWTRGSGLLPGPSWENTSKCW